MTSFINTFLTSLCSVGVGVNTTIFIGLVGGSINPQLIRTPLLVVVLLGSISLIGVFTGLIKSSSYK